MRVGFVCGAAGLIEPTVGTPCWQTPAKNRSHAVMLCCVLRLLSLATGVGVGVGCVRDVSFYEVTHPAPGMFSAPAKATIYRVSLLLSSSVFHHLSSALVLSSCVRLVRSFVTKVLTVRVCVCMRVCRYV